MDEIKAFQNQQAKRKGKVFFQSVCLPCWRSLLGESVDLRGNERIQRCSGWRDWSSGGQTCNQKEVAGSSRIQELFMRNLQVQKMAESNSDSS